MSDGGVTLHRDQCMAIGTCVVCHNAFMIGVEEPGFFGSWPDWITVECPACKREYDYFVRNEDEYFDNAWDTRE